jgi:5'-3' exonuclease
MGVPGFFAWLLKNKKKLGANKLILKEISIKIKWLMLDTNCLLHPCVANILEKYKDGMLNIDKTKDLRTQIEYYIWEKITQYIDDMIEQIQPEYLYIGIDGVAPIGKILQQRQRRYRFLFDKKIKLNIIDTMNQLDEILNKTIIKTNGIEEPILPLSSIELTPGTDYMERLNILMKNYVENIIKKRCIKCIYSSYHDEGEGEHKILQYIKNNLTSLDTIVIYGLDADLLFLSLGLGYEYDLYVMRESQVFVNKEINLDEVPEYNYVEIKQLHLLISNIEISTNDFIILCYLIGNDFLPGILTIDVKKGGLDKIFKAWTNLKYKFGIQLEYESNINSKSDDFKIIKSYLVRYDINKKKYLLDLKILKGLFKELLWTEKYTWLNMNRDKILNQNNLDQEEILKLHEFNNINKKEQMEKFINGHTSYTDFLDKIEFSSSNEYYNYYLGIKCIEIDKSIINKMVFDYIGGIEWCIGYYLDKCQSWTWGYNFMIAPLIKDILNFFPQSNNQININYNSRTLNPVEQLILAIPPQTYKYVIEKDLIEKIISNKSIGYMFPESFQIDINKELVFWKCQVKIPIVEYTEFEREIKKLNISNEKNKIYKFIKNY